MPGASMGNHFTSNAIERLEFWFLEAKPFGKTAGWFMECRELMSCVYIESTKDFCLVYMSP